MTAAITTLNLDRENAEPLAAMPELPPDLSRFDNGVLSQLANILRGAVVAYVRAGQIADARAAVNDLDRITDRIEAVAATCDCDSCASRREGSGGASASKRAPDGGLLQ